MHLLYKITGMGYIVEFYHKERVDFVKNTMMKVTTEFCIALLMF